MTHRNLKVLRPIFALASLSLYLIVVPLHFYISTKDLIVLELPKKYEYGVVFGAGLSHDGGPGDALKDRLDTGARLYNEGMVEKLLLSGINIEDHQEVTVMFDYLVEEWSVPDYALVIDINGVRTFETCRNLNEDFNIYEAVVITSGYHLPRTITLCQDQGVDVIGVSSTMQKYRGQTSYSIREFFAIHLAVFDIIFS